MRNAADRNPSEGIYFIVCFPAGWRLKAFRFDQFPEGGHCDFWESHIAPELALAWAHVVGGGSAAGIGRHASRFATEIALHYDGFPRGRVTRVGRTRRFAVFHGSNLTSAMSVLPAQIERAFGISGRAAWCFDEHEQCSAFSAEALRTLLSIGTSWPTVCVGAD